MKKQSKGIASSDIALQINADAERLKESAYVGPAHDKIMSDLLQQIGPVNFREKAGVGDDEDAKLSKAHIKDTFR